MKSLLLILALFAQNYWDDTPVMSSLKTHVEELTLSQNEGRAPGSEGEKFAADYIRDVLRSAGVDLLSGENGDEFGIVNPSGGRDTLRSRNVIGFIQGYDAALRDRYIVVGARLDNLGANLLTVDGVPCRQIYSGACGNASGLAVMCELARKVQSSSLILRRSVLFVAFGSSTSSFAGAWHFLHQTFASDASKIDAMVNLDMLGTARGGLQAFTSGNDDLNSILGSVNGTPQPLKAQLITQEPYPSDHQVFYAGEIPSIYFTSGRYPEHNTPRDVASILDYEFMERETEYIFNFLITLVNQREGVPAFRKVVEEESVADGKNVYNWSDCDTPPTFLGVSDPTFFLRKWVYQYLKYPRECIEDGVQGRVMVGFTIGKDGAIKDVHIVRGVDEQLDEAALKVILAAPKWKPGKVNGRKVETLMTIPVDFRLKKRK